MSQQPGSKKSVLLIMNVPPPYQGTTIMNKYLLESLQEDKIEHLHFKVESAKELSNIGKFGMRKFKSAISILGRIFGKRNKYDKAFLVMSVNGFAFYRHASFILLLQAMGKKCILHLQGLGFQHKKGFGRLITKRIFTRAHLIQHSPYNSFDIEKYGCKNVHYVPNCLVDQYPFFEAERDNYRQHPSPVVNVIFLANLIQDKGIFTAIESAKILCEKNNAIQIKWNFVGKWQDEPTKQAFFNYIQQNNLQQYIGHIGPLYNDEKHAFLTKMDIMVFPTYYKHETWGNVILEGMMFKIPVIASNYVAIPEMIKDNVNGYLIPKKDATMLAEKTLLLAQSAELRTTMGEAGRKMFLENFTQDKFKNKMINILNDINQ